MSICSPFEKIFATTFLIYSYDPLAGLEVRAARVVVRGHPHTLTLAGFGLWSHHVCQNNVTIEGMLVDVCSRGIKVCTSAHDTLSLATLTFFSIRKPMNHQREYRTAPL